VCACPRLNGIEHVSPEFRNPFWVSIALRLGIAFVGTPETWRALGAKSASPTGYRRPSPGPGIPSSRKDSRVAQTYDYRPDIDGMRAIAVLLVIFYHAGFETFSGGFIGVDIFFVISGYLITGIVARELSRGDFTFARFYTRRIKRLLPAFYSVVIVSAVVGYAVLLPGELRAFAESTLAALFFVSNFYFGTVTEGYFAPEVETLPLLHTWSLAVEEQFYFVWPVSLMLLRRRLDPRYLVPLLCALMVASFACAEIAVRSLSDTVYYALWSRAGELLIGAILALRHREEAADTRSRPGNLAELFLTLLGFGLVAGPAVLLDDGSTFPGLNALWPCLGIAILIHVGRVSGAVSRPVLSLPPLVFTGLISYALYLWHWPIFVFARALRIEFSAGVAWTLIAIAFAFATLSWRFVERPIRYRRDVSFRAALLWIFGAPAFGLAAAGLFAVVSGGIESRFSPEVLDSLATARFGAEKARGICVRLDEIELPPEAECLLGAGTEGARKTDSGETGGPDALLWGDSIANHYSGFFDEVGRASGIQLRDVTMAGCPPILDTLRLDRRKGPICRARNDEVMELIRRSDFGTVYIGGNWASYLEPGGFLGDAVDTTRSPENSARVLRAGLERTVAAILRVGKTPVILRNVPRMDFDAATCAVKNRIHPERFQRTCRMDLVRHEADIQAVDAILRDLQSDHPRLRFLSPLELICPEGSCVAELAGVPLYKDLYHLNMEGSRTLGRAYLARYGPLELSKLR